MKAELTCPNCSAKTTVDIPQNGCSAFYECSGCGQIIGTPKAGDSCCVVCAYSETTCPLPHKLKETGKMSIVVLSWLLFAGFSIVLLLGYYAGQSHPEMQPYLKGLTTLQHFMVHYSVGVLAGLIVCILWLVFKKRRANEGLVLLISVFLAHEPDFRFAMRRLPHDAWEVIFLGHTLVDEAFYPVVLLATFGIIVASLSYVKLIDKLKVQGHKGNTS